MGWEYSGTFEKIDGSAGTLEHEYPVTAVVYSMDGTSLYSAGIDNNITAWDLRTNAQMMKMNEHTDTITCLTLHPKGTHLLSNSMDGSMRSWDIHLFGIATGSDQNKTGTIFVRMIAAVVKRKN